MRISSLRWKRGLALGVILDRGVVGDGRDQPGDLGAEAPLELLDAGVGVLQHVVEDSGGDDLVRVAGLVQQAGHLRGMGEERRRVGVARLALVPPGGEGERVAGQRRAIDEVRSGHRCEVFETVHGANVRSSVATTVTRR